MIWLFAAAAATLVLMALALVLRPLLARAPAAPESAERSNLDILRDQLAELESDRRMGVISEDQYRSAREDLQRRALEEAQPPAKAETSSRSSAATAATAGAAICVAAAALYV